MSTSDPYWRVKDLFIATLDKPAEQRDAFLREACKDDPGLLSEVLEMMSAHERAASLLDQPTAIPAHPLGNGASFERPGDVIGPYKLLERIGEGGFGTVYMAEQEQPVRRRVALKIIKLGMDTKQVIARFEAERQALAIMEHAGIAKVFDAGATATGRPYFVMELVTGEPITDYCDRNNLSIRQRLDVFIQVCQAVQHAHQKGLIHRDIKPSNVLVSTQDEQPVAKVIDFGIAKATQVRLTEKTLFTKFRQFIGTPEYMSPEQAAGSLDIDTRSDVYSLGVLLYELLTGATPFDARSLRSKAYAEIERIICEVDPPKPSTKLSTLDALPSVAARRSTEPRRLSASVRGELDWIVMKAMEKDHTRRYESASSLAADVLHHLANEPVSAAAPSRMYRFRKFVARNRGPVIAASLLVASLVAGLAGTLWQARRAADRAEIAERARAAEQQARTRAEAINEFVNKALIASDPNEGGRQDMLVADAMINALHEIEAGAFKDDPETEASLRGTIAHILNGNGRPAQAEAPARRALQIEQQLHPGDHPLVAGRLSDLAEVLQSLGRGAEAEPLMLQSLQMNQRLYKADHPDVATTLNNLAVVLAFSGRAAEAESLCHQALEMRQRLFKGDHLSVAESLSNLAIISRLLGRTADAEPLTLQALQMRRRLLNGDHPRVAINLNNLAYVREALGRPADAEPLYVEALEMNQRLFKGDHPRVAVNLENLANVRLLLGHPAEADSLLQQALEMNQRLFKGDHPDIATNLNNLANVRRALGRAAEAEQMYVQAMEMYQRLYKGDHPDLAQTLNQLAHLRQSMGRAAEAEPLFVRALEMNQRMFKGDAPAVALSLNNLAGVRRALGRDADAEVLYIQAVEMLQRLFKDGHPDTVQCLNNLADCLDALGRHEQAAERRREAQSVLRKPPSQLLPVTQPVTTQSGSR